MLVGWLVQILRLHVIWKPCPHWNRWMRWNLSLFICLFPWCAEVIDNWLCYVDLFQRLLVHMFQTHIHVYMKANNGSCAWTVWTISEVLQVQFCVCCFFFHAALRWWLSPVQFSCLLWSLPLETCLSQKRDDHLPRPRFIWSVLRGNFRVLNWPRKPRLATPWHAMAMEKAPRTPWKRCSVTMQGVYDYVTGFMFISCCLHARWDLLMLSSCVFQPWFTWLIWEATSEFSSGRGNWGVWFLAPRTLWTPCSVANHRGVLYLVACMDEMCLYSW